MKHITFFLLLFCTSISNSQTKTEVQPFLADIVSQFPNVRDIAINSTKDEVVFSAQSVIGDVSALVTARKN